MAAYRSPLARLPSEVRRALNASIGQWIPAESLALYARWWELETWLRQLVYVELRAFHGRAWENSVGAAIGRQAQDAQFQHMANEDTDNPLAYLDYSQLRAVIEAEANWPLFAPSLLHRPVWDGRQEELARIRHRVSHVRRPHTDDLQRLEQTLRDLERGAFIAFASYNRQFEPNPAVHHDAVTTGWISGEHSVARRLLEHADRQYGTRLLLQFSRRPWAERPTTLVAAPGVLWHANFYMRKRNVDIQRLWDRLHHIRPLLVHLVVDDPSTVSFVFSAMDDDTSIADAIGSAFDALLTTSQDGYLDEGSQLRRWEQRTPAVDYRVLHGTGWNVIGESTVPITIFGAGGGVMGESHARTPPSLR
jgi:hypothetical protein